MKYMLRLPEKKKVSLPNGQLRFENTESKYLPVAPRIAWFREEHPYWSIITEVEKRGDKAGVMKATIKDNWGNVIATASQKETGTGSIGRALAMCGYSTLQAPEFDEQDHLADVPVVKNANYALRVGLEKFKSTKKGL